MKTTAGPSTPHIITFAMICSGRDEELEDLNIPYSSRYRGSSVPLLLWSRPELGGVPCFAVLGAVHYLSPAARAKIGQWLSPQHAGKKCSRHII
jgi:hypothetical protein